MKDKIILALYVSGIACAAIMFWGVVFWMLDGDYSSYGSFIFIQRSILFGGLSVVFVLCSLLLDCAGETTRQKQ